MHPKPRLTVTIVLVEEQHSSSSVWLKERTKSDRRCFGRRRETLDDRLKDRVVEIVIAIETEDLNLRSNSRL